MERKKISLECLAKLLGISSDISLCSPCPPLNTNQPEATTSAVGSAGSRLPEAEECWKTWGWRGQREGISPCPSRQPGEGQHPFFSSQL